MLNESPKPEIPKLENKQEVVLTDITNFERVGGEVKPFEFPD